LADIVSVSDDDKDDDDDVPRFSQLSLMRNIEIKKLNDKKAK